MAKNKITPVDLKSFYRENYNGSELQSINRNKHLPHKCTIDNQDFYYYNADLSGLMWLQGNDRRLKYNDFIYVYRKGFSDGLKHLQEQEGIKRRDYNNPEQRELIKKDLNYFLFEREFLPNHKGLQDLMKKTLLRWTEDNIYKQGYFNGLLHSIVTLDNNLNLNIGGSETSNNTTTTPATLKSFFPNIEDTKVNEIQNEFKDLAIGKEMAILIYLLTKEKKILIIDDNNKNTSSRLHFLRAFTGKNLKRSGGIGNFIEGTTGELKEKVSKKDDPTYIKISQRLDKMV